MRLLCICYEFPPDTTPTGIRTGKLLSRFPADWEIDVVTVSRPNQINGRYQLFEAVDPGAGILKRGLRKIRLQKCVEWMTLLDDKQSWITPAIAAGRTAIQQNRPDAIVAFMMPYSCGEVGFKLKNEFGLPLVLNFDDSPTCLDMHPFFTSRLHYELARRFEDRLVQSASAAIYVSKHNLEAVRDRQPEGHWEKFELIRYGADPEDFTSTLADDKANQKFRIVYIGGMSGWYQFYHRLTDRSLGRTVFRFWTKLGRYHRATLDQRSSSPIYIGRAVQGVIKSQPDLQGKIDVQVFGNRYSMQDIERVLANENLADVVAVFGPISNREAVAKARSADLLFMTLPDRDPSLPGGRISAKTYEYLATDRPILAALPTGENRNFMKDWPGVFLVQPTDSAAMESIVRDLMRRKLAGETLSFDRSAGGSVFSYDRLSDQFCSVIRRACGG